MPGRETLPWHWPGAEGPSVRCRERRYGEPLTLSRPSPRPVDNVARGPPYRTLVRSCEDTPFCPESPCVAQAPGHTLTAETTGVLMLTVRFCADPVNPQRTDE